ncbi:MAG: hypothetical protein NT085_02335 [candidate division SR1 bacterium]|nr:hypothetical protein [candidate division SR1 bacterium]
MRPEKTGPKHTIIVLNTSNGRTVGVNKYLGKSEIKSLNQIPNNIGKSTEASIEVRPRIVKKQPVTTPSMSSIQTPRKKKQPSISQEIKYMFRGLGRGFESYQRTAYNH